MNGLDAVGAGSEHIALPGVSVWHSRIDGEALTYVTAGFQVPIETLDDLTLSEVLLAHWMTSALVGEARDQGLKVFARRQKDWVFIELVVPKSEHARAWEVLNKVLMLEFTASSVDVAVQAVRERLIAAQANRSVRADKMRWEPVFVDLPPQVDLMGEDGFLIVTPEAVGRLSEYLRLRARKSLVIVGSISRDEAEHGATAFAQWCGPSDESPTVSELAIHESNQTPAIHLRYESAPSGVSVRVVLPFGRQCSRELYVLMATALALGGDHFSPLQIRLRDQDAASYSPSTSVEVIAGHAHLCVNVDAAADGARAIATTGALLVEFLEFGDWRNYWEQGVHQLATIYTDAWDNARGRGVFISSQFAAGFDIESMVGIPGILASLDEEDFAGVLHETELEAAGGVVLGSFDDSVTKQVLRAAGFRVLTGGL